MKYVFVLLLVAATGFCTGEYVEQGDSFVDGIIQQGDVFEYYCEFASALQENEEFTLSVVYPNGQLLETYFAPSVLFGSTVVLYP